MASKRKYQHSLLNKHRYRRKIIVEEYDHVIDALEDRKLRILYNNGKACGVRKEKEIVQRNIRNKISLPSGTSFVYRAFVYVASYDPLVVYFKHGYILRSKESDNDKFSDRVIPLEDLASQFS